MCLTKIEISRLRNIERAALSPSAHLNILVGENGSGKTSVLEAIYLLGRARSFRTAQSTHLIQFKQPESLISGVIQSECGPRIHIGVRLARQQREIHLEGRLAQSSADLVRAFPVLVIQPSSALLLEGTPRCRRQFLDWGTFHVEPSYLNHWRRFAKALNQRNAVLKRGRPADLGPWNHEVAQYGTIVAEARERYLCRLAPYLNDAVGAFFPDHSVEVAYSQGWKADRPLADLMREDAVEDLRQGFTRSGPQRGDFTVSINGVPARLYLSRGQTKLLVYALLLAQAGLAEATAGSICVLIDDLASELDRGNRQRLIDLLLRRRTQCFVTAVHPEDIGCSLVGDAKMFHVEHGGVSEAKWKST